MLTLSRREDDEEADALLLLLLPLPLALAAATPAPSAPVVSGASECSVSACIDVSIVAAVRPGARLGNWTDTACLAAQFDFLCFLFRFASIRSLSARGCRGCRTSLSDPVHWSNAARVGGGCIPRPRPLAVPRCSRVRSSSSSVVSARSQLGSARRRVGSTRDANSGDGRRRGATEMRLTDGGCDDNEMALQRARLVDSLRIHSNPTDRCSLLALRLCRCHCDRAFQRAILLRDLASAASEAG